MTFQSEEHIGACLASLDRCAPGGTEVIVVDNGSTDATCAIVREAAPSATLVSLPSNVGFAAGVNIGARRSSGRYNLLLNPDAALMPGSLDILVTHLDEHPFVAAAGPQFVAADGAEQDSAFTYPSLLMCWLEFFPWPARLLHGRSNGRIISRDGEPVLVDHPLGACILIRRSAWRDVGPLDEGFFLYCEEVDWCMRAKARGWLITTVPAARVIHHGGASAASAPRASIVHLYASRRRLHRKHRGPVIRAAMRFITALGLAQERRRLRRQTANPSAAARAAGINQLLRSRGRGENP